MPRPLQAAPAALQDDPAWLRETLAPLPTMLTAKEAAAVLRVSMRTFGRLMASGQITVLRVTVSGAVRIPREALREYLLRLSSLEPRRGPNSTQPRRLGGAR